ncbi:MAG TPA: ribosomal protein S18-alanine N-acetyltransferase [Vicinamibacteria bacterium]|nr:ribosomal protein S18-alanine N-acetyltransferase [Vicinamibacteria bacterium]
MSPGVLLRQAHAPDLAALTTLEAACFSNPWTEVQIEEEMAAAPPGGVFVLEGPPRHDAVTGICAYCAFRLVLDEMHVMNLAVAPGARRRGLGRRLLAFALRRAARAGARAAFLELRVGNQAALALYESLGFRPLSRRRAYYRRPFEDALVLVLEALSSGPAAPARQP